MIRMKVIHVPSGLEEDAVKGFVESFRSGGTHFPVANLRLTGDSRKFLWNHQREWPLPSDLVGREIELYYFTSSGESVYCDALRCDVRGGEYLIFSRDAKVPREKI